MLKLLYKHPSSPSHLPSKAYTRASVFQLFSWRLLKGPLHPTLHLVTPYSSMIFSPLLLERVQDTLIPAASYQRLTQELATETGNFAERKAFSNFGPRLKGSSHALLSYNSKTLSRTLDPNTLQELEKPSLHSLFGSTEKGEDEGYAGWTATTKATNAHVNSQDQEEKEEEEPIAKERDHLSYQEDSDDIHTLVASLKDCIKQRDLQKGSRIHANIVGRGILQDNIFLGNTLVNLYAKCGALEKAEEVCNKLPFRTVVSWNVLIAGYAECGLGEAALHCLKQMQFEGLSPDAITFTSILKACNSKGTIDKIQELHVQIEKEGLLEKDVVLGTVLVDTYGKLGAVARAQQVFHKLPYCDAISWNVLVAGYAQHGHGPEALICFEQMQCRGFSPNEVTFVSTFKACATMGEAHMGQELHAQSVKLGLDGNDIVVANALIDMYGKCGLLAEAHDVFEKLSFRDVISFGSLIAGYAHHGCGEEAAMCFEHMKTEGIAPNVVTFVSILKAYGIIKAADKGVRIHAQIVREGVLEEDMIASRALIDMYTKCRLFEEAQDVFDKLLDWDVYSCNMLMAEYSQHGYNEEALSCFERLQGKGISPNAVTYVCALKACANIGAFDKGEQIHEQIVTNGALEKDLVVGTTLVDMYARFGSFVKAQEVFDKLPVRDVVSWNTLIGGFSQHNYGKEAISCYKRMQFEGFLPDAVTFVCTLKACGSIRAVYQGLEIHNEILKKGFLEKDAVIGTVLVDMYAKCGMLAEAQEVFDELPVRDVVSWNALIAEYTQSGHSEGALSCLKLMQLDGLSANAYTFSSVLKACGSIGVIHLGQDLHGKVVKEGLLGRDIVVANALMDMYSNFGMLGKAHQVFENLKVRDVVSWNALIGGYAQLGKDTFVFKAFEKMIGEGIAPDMVTFTIVLNTCSHTGQLDKGQAFYETMTTCYSLVPNLEHHTCLIDLLGRAGHLGKAVAVIREMPFCANLALWLVVLGSCQRWGKTSLGRFAFQQAALLDNMDAAAYIGMGNML